MGIGLLFYGAYGYRHSNLRHGKHHPSYINGGDPEMEMDKTSSMSLNNGDYTAPIGRGSESRSATPPEVLEMEVAVRN
jgi:hypothetical protein